MNVYDFDKTIYRDDSSCDFYWFCLRRHKKILCRLPAQAAAFVRHYLLHTISKTQMKEVFYRYFRDIPDMEQELEVFWAAHLHKIEPYYLAQQQPEDVIISASPTFFAAGLPHAGYFKPYCIRGQPGDRGVHGHKLSRPRKSEAFSCTVSARTGGTFLLRFSLGFAHGKLGRKSLFGHKREMCAMAAGIIGVQNDGRILCIIIIEVPESRSFPALFHKISFCIKM